MERAEVTAFLSLIFILLVSFTGGIMESASIEMAKNYRRTDVNRAVESVFAEYQKELLEEYDIFALEGTYESGAYDEQLVKNRLDYFGAGGMDNGISRIQFLTDNGAQAFYEQTVCFMEHKYGISNVRDKVSQTDAWKMQEERSEDYEKESRQQSEEFESSLRRAAARCRKRTIRLHRHQS